MSYPIPNNSGDSLRRLMDLRSGMNETHRHTLSQFFPLKPNAECETILSGGMGCMSAMNDHIIEAIQQEVERSLNARDAAAQAEISMTQRIRVEVERALREKDAALNSGNTKRNKKEIKKENNSSGSKGQNTTTKLSKSQKRRANKRAVRGAQAKRANDKKMKALAIPRVDKAESATQSVYQAVSSHQGGLFGQTHQKAPTSDTQPSVLDYLMSMSSNNTSMNPSSYYGGMQGPAGFLDYQGDSVAAEVVPHQIYTHQFRLSSHERVSRGKKASLKINGIPKSGKNGPNPNLIELGSRAIKQEPELKPQVNEGDPRFKTENFDMMLEPTSPPRRYYDYKDRRRDISPTRPAPAIKCEEHTFSPNFSEMF